MTRIFSDEAHNPPIGIVLQTVVALAVPNQYGGQLSARDCIHEPVHAATCIRSVVARAHT
jgi:hypothetical protein